MITSILTREEKLDWINEALVYSDITDLVLKRRCCYIDCICNARIGWTEYFVNNNLELSDSQKLSLFVQWCAHIVYHIRMNGCKEHMDLLFAMYEDERAFRLIESFANKNEAMAKLMREYIINKKGN